MKAIYLTWPSERTFEHTKIAIQAGVVDTILMACQTVPANPPTNYFDTYQKHISDIIECKKFGVPVFPVIQWQREWTHDNMAVDRIMAAKDLLVEVGLNTIVWDVEDYRIQSQGIKQLPVPKDFVKRCKNYGVNVLGGMPSSLNKTWFVEDTYYDNPWWKVKFRGFRKDVIPGAFIEYHSDPVKYIKKLKRCYKNYWIYSHAILGQNMPDPNWQGFIQKKQLPFSFWHSF